MAQNIPALPRPRLQKRLSSSKQLCSKFFRRISVISPINKTPTIPVAERSVQDLRNMPRSNEPLQYSYDHNEEEDQREPQQSGRKKGVKFHETVTVVPVPLRKDYSGKIKTKLWIDKLEMCENVERNRIEFASEDFDWRKACSEDEMFICNDTRELIHPIHIANRRFTFDGQM
mmetsp:Transcript_32008/g.67751  ORF Transcript_32008/g.67751 Transcript_32008/m.67751 type:complete len:173 (-) Transcript_32008:183-701(-)|eukprot:CAMPEP_0183716328 /NCGR_PEP_ID=MMETSP0737-20130205/10289_1 /TAXON_ID=385413 /ORGANISM="Thalassiosira miniscula, Strain CCMP1093" /LENGTH=172 /DNA_ID=CAMNT_0025945587 /DNA_START=141 /DNA_END=659 /DNA_ORIENTATION=-